MKNYEEQALAGIELDDDAVMQYLLQNPDFFIRNARLVEQMHIPIRSEAVSRWWSGS